MVPTRITEFQNCASQNLAGNFLFSQFCFEQSSAAMALKTLSTELLLNHISGFNEPVATPDLLIIWFTRYIR